MMPMGMMFGSYQLLYFSVWLYKPPPGRKAIFRVYGFRDRAFRGYRPVLAYTLVLGVLEVEGVLGVWFI
jgi:hypothetical protein